MALKNVGNGSMPQITPPVADPVKSLTQHQKIVAQMCKYPEKQWWLASDFMKQELGELFVGYEATARLAELIGDNPEMFETERQGRFRAVRMRFETGKEWYSNIAPKLQRMVKLYYKGNQ
jgi:hypothetical protein